MPQRNIRLVIEYDGTNYSGWQWQKNARTIQGEILESICRTAGARPAIIAAGRTDAGVHALGQVANFRIDHDLDPGRYGDALNFYLPDDIRVKASGEVPLSFHARRDARFRRYRYLLAAERSAVYRRLRWEYPAGLDENLLRRAAALIPGEHDFAPFCVVTSRRENNLCRIDHARWHRMGPLLILEIRGNRFLHGMVRSLVGAMVNLATVERGNNPRNLTLTAFADIIESSTEQRVVFTAPAHGLYLVSVGYDKEFGT